MENSKLPFKTYYVASSDLGETPEDFGNTTTYEVVSLLDLRERIREMELKLEKHIGHAENKRNRENSIYWLGNRHGLQKALFIFRNKFGYGKDGKRG